jgi:GntR family transcriptional repressor for pyruvate dehydrogenase complex
LKFEPIRPISLVDMIVHRLEEMMLQGELTPGERLPPERDLARLMEVSRTSVRQALAILKERKLIHVRPGAGTFAKTEGGTLVITELAGELGSFKERVLNPMEVRRLIEPQIARLAAERATSGDVDAMALLIAAQEKRIAAGETFVEEDIAFHQRIAISTSNQLLVRLVDDVQLRLRDSREISLSSPAGSRSSLEGHKKIYDAISHHRSDAAYEAMAHHIETVANLILTSLTAANGNISNDAK